ncbi:MAG: polysaccharide deacetylase family protein [Candidatus Limnocylindrales bacterium]
MAGISRRALLTLAGQAVLAYAAAPFVRAASVTPLIALTIDDDWSAARVGSIFDTLQRASVAATFFPYAEATRSDPGLWRAITAAGYPYANHTRTHPWMTRLTPKAQAAEITEARTILEGITGTPMLPVFRPPYGAYDAQLLDVAQAAGFPTVLTWDTSDADTSSRATSAQLVQAAMRGTNGSVLLTHGGPILTPLILPTIISLYRDLGFRFVTVPEMLGWTTPSPPTPHQPRAPWPRAL